MCLRDRSRAQMGGRFDEKPPGKDDDCDEDDDYEMDSDDDDKEKEFDKRVSLRVSAVGVDG